MRKFRFVSERLNLRPGSSILLTDEDANHAHRTLRLKKGDLIYIFNGQKEFRAQLKLVSKEAVMANILEEVADASFTRKLDITLYVALTKSKSFDMILEKATEMGVTAIVPISTEYSVINVERVEGKFSRWQKIIASACKQSERIDIPELKEIIKYQEALDNMSDDQLNYIFSIDRDNKLTNILNVETNKDIKEIGLFIGPEGGFSPNEIRLFHDKALQNSYEVKLFDEVLRSETAVISALTAIRLKHE